MTNTIVDVPGIRVGHADDAIGLTGCTVLLMKGGAVAGVDVRGSAPGTRETDLLDPVNLVSEVHAICLTGGSAYGLDAASGVMRYLEEQGVGLNVGVGVVPIVPAAVLFDLACGDPSVRPNADMGYKAALRADTDPVRPVAEGNVGAGCGATVGKLAGPFSAMKSGLGSASITLPNGLVVGAIVAVNAVGNVRDPDTGAWIAGARDENDAILSATELLTRFASPDRRGDHGLMPGTNTTIAVVASNAKLTKSEATKVAQMAHDGLARTIFPIHTMHDGDTVFAVATGHVDAMTDVVGALSAEVLAQAVLRAVKAAEGVPGLPAWRDLRPRRA
ncbi:P1 family peptidase [Alicyclobacillus curvatus]|nr:P1 family peptidase [Alicyclobacillus curvatus]